MRATVSFDRFGWICGLDYKKLIIIVFLLRVITASAYDIYVTLTGNDILLPDSKFYSVKGRYVDLILEGYDKDSFTKDLLPGDRISQDIFACTADEEHGILPKKKNETVVYSYILGFVYLIFGYFTIWPRIFNICISILSAYLLFKVAKRYFGDLAANIFLIAALFLPAQFGYSITLSRDFLRVFVVSFVVWVIYMGAITIWPKK